MYGIMKWYIYLHLVDFYGKSVGTYYVVPLIRHGIVASHFQDGLLVHAAPSALSPTPQICLSVKT